MFISETFEIFVCTEIFYVIKQCKHFTAFLTTRKTTFEWKFWKVRKREFRSDNVHQKMRCFTSFSSFDFGDASRLFHTWVLLSRISCKTWEKFEVLSVESMSFGAEWVISKKVVLISEKAFLRYHSIIWWDFFDTYQNLTWMLK